MTRRHSPWGWSCGGLSGLELAGAACPVPCPPALSGLTPSLLSVGLFKISSMEKGRPSFFGPSQHPEFFLSIPLQRAGLSVSGCEEGRGDSECAQGDAGGRWRTSSPEPSGIKRASRGGGRGASLMSDYPSTIPSPWGLPWATSNHPQNQRGRSHGKSWNRLYPVATGAEPTPARRKGVAVTKLGLVFLRGSSRGGRSHSVQPRPGFLRSLPVGNGTELEGRGSLPEGKAGQRAHLCSFSALRPFPAVSRPLEGWGATLGSQAAKVVLGHTAA